MLGLCENSTNCADNYACAVIFMEPIGYCSEGNLDAVCGNDLDCQDDLFCHLPIQNSLGQCQPVGSITCDSAGGVCWDQTSGSCPADSMYNSNYRCQDTAMDCCL